MKKIFWGLAALTLSVMALATSCGNEHVESKNDVALTFKTAVGRQTATRASETTSASIESETLNVWAYFNSGDDADELFRHYELTYASSKWTYGDPDFHPTEGLTHYSVYPVDGTTFELDGVDAANSDATFEYVIPGTQVDLIVAVDTTTGDSAANATADLVYSHILSQVNFAVAGIENAIITISDIKLGDVKNSSTYGFVSGWDVPTGAVPYTYAIDGDGKTSGDADEIVYFGNSTATGETTNHTNALMLMPQDFTAATGAYFTFDYTITNMDATPVVLKSGNDEKVFFGDLAIKTWTKGKRYVYVINFEDLHYIRYTVDVEDWEDYDNNGGEINTDDIE